MPPVFYDGILLSFIRKSEGGGRKDGKKGRKK